MTIVPIKDLKDGAKISQLCHETNEPVHVTKNGYSDLVIMSADTFAELERQAWLGRTAAAIQEGINSVQAGEYTDAFDALEGIRNKYGI